MIHTSALAPATGACARLRWAASLLALGFCALTVAPDASAQTPPCQVTYTKAWQGGNGYGANLEIRNNGPAINGWTMTFSFLNGERIQNGWPVTFSQPADSAQVTVASNAPWNASIPTGATLTIGFNGTFTTTNSAPATFVLNGVTCNSGGTIPQPTPPTVVLTSPSSGQTFPSATGVSLAATTTGTVTRVEFRIDGNLVNTDTSAPYAFTANGLAAGNHTAQAVAFDNSTPALSASSGSVAFTVQAVPQLSINTTPAALTVQSGQSGTASITLSAAPANPVTVAIARSGSTAISHAPTSVTLTSSNWNTGASVTFTAAAGTTAATSTFTASATNYAAKTITVTRPAGPVSSAVFRVDSNGRITKNGTVFPVHCGSWFGLEGRHEPPSDPVNPNGAPMEQYLGNPVYANGGAGTGRTLQQTMSEIAGMGINMIRLPVVPQTLSTNDPQGTGNVLKNHPSVRVANSRLALEQFIVAAAQNNIEIMLDMHSCSNFVGWRKGRLDARPPWADATRDNYNYKRENYSCAATGNPSTVTTTHPYSESLWLDNLRTLAGMGQQLGVDNIIGIDIYNEPHDYTWAEWKRLTESAYQAINSVNPNTLLFVQGIGTSANAQDGTPATTVAVPHGAAESNPNWGENLFEAGTNPINIPKERLVFSPHTYGPSVFVQPMFMDPAQPQCSGLDGDAAGDARCNIVINPTLLRAGWEEHFGYLRKQGYAVVVGEFGGNMDWPRGQANLRDRNRWGHITAPVDAQWQDAFVSYMVDNQIDGCYWSINPESGDTGGWYGHEFDPVSDQGWGIWRTFDQRKTNLLNRLWGR